MNSLFRCLQNEGELAEILRNQRIKRGSIDFDFPETKIVLNEQGEPIDLKPYDRNAATKIIEDFMLIANETVAEDYFWQEIPFVYRTHEQPDAEKIQKVGTFINNFGYTMKIGQDAVRPKEMQKLLVKIEGTHEEALISRLALRSMKQAKYTTGYGTFRFCHTVLLSFYVADQALSGSADPPDHQGRFARKNE